MNNTLLSIVMTTYNEEENVRESIDAILKQDYKNFELIIVDDGSEDNTVEIIKRYSDNRIRFFQRSHQGRASTLNFVIKKSKGKYIAINDADDISINNRFYKQVNFLENHPDIGMVGAQGYILYTHKGQQVEFNKPLEYEQIKQKLLFENTFIHSSVMFRKEIFDQGIYYDEKFTKFGIEYELWSRILPDIKAVNLKDRLIIYKVHSTNTFKKRNPFTKFKHQVIMRYLVFKRLKYPCKNLPLIFYMPCIYLIKDCTRWILNSCR